MATDIMKYEVWLSRDDDDGSIVIVIDGVERSGQVAWIADKRFDKYDDWERIAAWVWRKVSLALPLSPG